MKQIKRYNITKAGRKYQDRNGVEKTVWNNIGTLTEFHKEDGTVSRLIEIPAIGLEANVFEIKPKEDNQTEQTPKEAPAEYPEDIPF